MVPDRNKRIFPLEAIRPEAVEAEWSRFDAAASLIDDALIVLNQKDQIVTINRTGAELLGSQPADLIGQSINDCLPPIGQEALTVLHGQAWINRGQVKIGRIIFSLTNGRELDIEVKLLVPLVGEEYFLFLRDASHFRVKEMEKALKETRDYLRNVMENAFDMVITTDLQAKIVSFNRGAERVLGYSRQEVLGQSVEILWPNPEERRTLMRRIEHFDGAISNYETRLRHKNGTLINISMTLSYLTNNEGRVIGTVGISRDITAKKKIEAELEKMKDELEEAQIQVLHAEKMASMGKLATSIAHEINNPLSSILLFSEMVLEEMPNEDQRRPDLVNIKEQTIRCKEIVRGLLDFGHRTSNNFVLFDLNHCIERSLALFANQAIFQGVQIIMDLALDLPQVFGDVGQISQVFTNLIINAIDAMTGQGRLTVTTSYDPKRDEVLAGFRDTGRGIEPEVLVRIFEPFFTTKSLGEGLGLGLSTSFGIAQKHGGRIEVESWPGLGAVFTVHLPVKGPGEE